MKRTLFLLGLTLAAGSALHAMEGADMKAKMQEEFQAKKQAVLKDLDSKIAVFTKSKACVSAASDHEGLKKCFEEEQAAMKSMMQAKKQEQIKQIEEQQKKLEQKKQDLMQMFDNKQPESKEPAKQEPEKKK